MRIKEGASALVEFCVSQGDMDAFRHLSADVNPLHDDAEYARERGFAGTVVYGGLIVAQISRLLGTRLPGSGCIWRSFALRFRNPLYVGQRARASGTVVHVNEELGLFDLKLRVEAAGACVAEGEAAAMVVRVREGAHG